jgi:hypothetical protein
MTTYRESTTGLLVPPSSNGLPLTEASREYALMVELYESRIGQLEIQLQEQGWMKLDEGAGREFSREALGKIVELARVNYLKNPLINRAVEIGALYVWGQDVSVSAEDEDVQAVVDRFWRDNRRVLTGQQASRLLEVELEVTGNVFLALFPEQITGQVRVRTVPMEEIREIITNPDDRYEPWYYKRTWTQRPVDGGKPVEMTAYYPDWQYQPSAKPEKVGDHEVRWDAPVLHVKAGAFPHWTWGVSEVYAALDWARAYKQLLEDDATRSRALARFAWSLSTKGGSGGIAAAKTKLGTTLRGANGETNPPPASGSTFIAGDGVSMDPIKIAGATLPPDHSRPARQMASAALGIPDHFFDANQSNLATSKTLDRPTELRYTERRGMWVDVLTDLLQWVIDRDLEAPRGLAPKNLTEEQRKVELAFPSLLERDAREVVGAIVDAATLSGRTAAGTIAEETLSRELMVALGIDDVDGELEKIEDEREEREERAAQVAQQTQPRDQEQDEEREAFVAALRELREALK